MMNVTADAQYAATAQATIARLPYGNGRYAMVFALPGAGVTLEELAASLTPATWSALTGSLNAMKVAITLPKFKATWQAPLQTALTRMGMGLAFDRNNADFSALSTTRDYLSAVLQATTVDVDETGTTATGTTVVVVAPTAVLTPPSVVLNQPFLYAIQDTKTGELLFIGQMMDPMAG